MIMLVHQKHEKIVRHVPAIVTVFLVHVFDAPQ